MNEEMRRGLISARDRFQEIIDNEHCHYFHEIACGAGCKTIAEGAIESINEALPVWDRKPARPDIREMGG